MSKLRGRLPQFEPSVVTSVRIKDELLKRIPAGNRNAWIIDAIEQKLGKAHGKPADRDNLEWLVAHALRNFDTEPCISMSRGKELLGFSDMVQMRNWLKNMPVMEPRCTKQQ